ncbi:hypothetical protein FGIG_07021 [Fasciola gigantica]|uniref:Uncharacterized protein n=1 Tax=Fasciola gigantica TaxID=46835 RepID=A0A504YIR2_FASGI|nr:hypothetical protein FGIG_07021 [Fasciola gigantica]
MISKTSVVRQMRRQKITSLFDISTDFSVIFVFKLPNPTHIRSKFCHTFMLLFGAFLQASFHSRSLQVMIFYLRTSDCFNYLDNSGNSLILISNVGVSDNLRGVGLYLTYV